MSRNLTKNYAFIDGSFNPDNMTYGCGGFLIDQFGNKHIIKKCGTDPSLTRMRNVAGELLGARTVILKALELGMDELIIFYDYAGVEAWPTGVWKCNNSETKSYSDFVRSVLCSTKLKIYFQHVRGHSGVYGNEEADRLAKDAVGLRGEDYL